MQGGMNNELWLSHASEMEPQVDLQDRIWEELRRESPTNIGDVNVWVEDFVVTLKGTVPSYEARTVVQYVTEHVTGVHAVLNELNIVFPA